MRNAGAFKGATDTKPQGGKAPQAQAMKDRREKAREEEIRRGSEPSILDRKGDRA